MSIASNLQTCHFSVRGRAISIRAAGSWSYRPDPVRLLETFLVDATLAESQRVIILSRLELFRGHRALTAQSLGIGLRTLGMKLKAWGIQR